MKTKHFCSILTVSQNISSVMKGSSGYIILQYLNIYQGIPHASPFLCGAVQAAIYPSYHFYSKPATSCIFYSNICWSGHPHKYFEEGLQWEQMMAVPGDPGYKQLQSHIQKLLGLRNITETHNPSTHSMSVYTGVQYKIFIKLTYKPYCSLHCFKLKSSIRN